MRRDPRAQYLAAEQERRRRGAFRAFALVCALLVITLGGLGIIGLRWGNAVLGGRWLGWFWAKPLAAGLQIFAGIGLALLCGEAPDRWRRQLAGLCGLAVSLVSASSWVLWGASWFDFSEVAARWGWLLPRPLGMAWLFIHGIALFALSRDRHRLSDGAAGLGLVIGLVTLVGQLYVASFFRPAGLAPMSLVATLSSILLGLGILMARPQGGMAAVMAGSGSGGLLLRRALIWAVLIPLLFSWLETWGRAVGFYREAFGSALLTTASMFGFVLVILWTSRSIERADAALRHAAAQIFDLYDRAPCGYHSAAPDGTIVQINDTELAWLGYTAEEIVGRKKFNDLLTPASVPLFETNFPRFLAQGHTQNLEFEMCRKDGTTFWVLLSGTAVRDAAGHLLYSRSTVFDITARKAAEATSRRLTAILEATPDLVGIFDVEGRTLYLNRAGRELVGVPPTGIAERSIADYHPPWAASLVLREGLPTAMRAGQWQGETALLSVREGEVPVSQVILAHRGDTGRIEFLSTVMHDIREHKRAEEAQRFLAEASRSLSSSLVYDDVRQQILALLVPRYADYCLLDLFDEDGRVSRGAATHRDPDLQPIVDQLAQFLTAAPKAVGIGHVLQTGEAEMIAHVADAWLQAISGSPEHFRLLQALDPGSEIIVPLVARGRTLGALTLGCGAGGRTYGPADLWLAQEFAVRSALAIDNALLYQQAQQATLTRDEVLAIVSHDLRNPLQVITLSSGYLLQLLAANPEQTALRGLVEGIAKAATRMATLIRDLLQVDRLEAKGLAVVAKPCTVTDLVREAVILQGPVAEGLSQQLITDVAAGEVQVLADGDRVLQVLGNLLSNAIDHTPQGGCITLAATRAGSRVRFAVTDTGPGIPVEEQKHLFDRYWQAKHSQRAGAGLGLAIAKGIVAAHGGVIGVESTPGQGSTFWFELPVARPAAATGRDAA